MGLLGGSYDIHEEFKFKFLASFKVHFGWHNPTWRLYHTISAVPLSEGLFTIVTSCKCSYEAHDSNRDRPACGGSSPSLDVQP